MQSASELDEITTPLQDLHVTFPQVDGNLDQDEEWFEFVDDGTTRRLRIHDYRAIFSEPGLYEALVYQALECRSPEHAVRPLEEALSAAGGTLADLRVIDLGAGNGIVGELLHRAGAASVIGIDILPEAQAAARRDHPEAYADYLVVDLAQPDPAALARLQRARPNCLVTVAALGFGDIPAEAFARALNLLPNDGWVVMCLKERFLEEDDRSGFGRLVRGAVANGALEVVNRERYVHRKSIQGEELHYVSVVTRKRRDVTAG